MFRSTDDGASWTAADTGLTNTNAEAIVACVSGGVTELFVATGDGVFRSTDFGAGWVITGQRGSNINVLLSYPSGASVPYLFAGSSGGVSLSTDNGTTWTGINSGLINTEISCLTTASYGGQTGLYAGTTGNGVWRYPLSAMVVSDTNWSGVEPGLANMCVRSFTFVPAGGGRSGTDVLAVTGYSGYPPYLYSGGRLYRSTDNGKDWSGIDSSIAGGVTCVGVIPPDNGSGTSTLIAGTIGKLGSGVLILTPPVQRMKARPGMAR